MTRSEGETTAQHVRRRRVFYIPGYDPFHPRRYRELYRKESAEQARISDYEVTLRPKQGGGRYGWCVSNCIDGLETETEIDVLVWSDIVKTSMGHTILATYGAMLRTAWAYIGSGALFRLMRLRKGPVIAALYPVVMLLIQAQLAALIVYGLARGAGTWGVVALGSWSWWLGVALGLGLAWAFLDLLRRWDNKFFVYYLMHDYSYSARYKGANPPELEARMGEFKIAIQEALASDVDEVLVVGHSSGAHLGVSILADLTREGLQGQGAVLAFLSLGHVVPMVSFLPRAQRLRRDLHELCQRSDIIWVDVSAPGDGCAFALCDPVAVSGIAPRSGKRWPIVFSAAFTQSLSPERWKDLKRRYFRLHFQYLCAFDRPKDYDYFQITAGPFTLADRYANRPPSKSRIEAPVNCYTDMAP